MENMDKGNAPQSRVPCENISSQNKRISLSSRKHFNFDEYKEKTANQILCDPCLILEKQEVATSLCSECDERLCANCTNQHTTRKITKSHVLVRTISTSQIMVECGFCDIETDQRSSVYCNDCEETLCKSCEQKHREKKIFKSHNLLVPDSKARQQMLFCDPCKENDEMKNAETFCSMCEENLCDICTRYHRAQKATKDHELQSLSLPFNATLCDPCNEDGMATQATGVCVQCEENLCDECARQHKLMKMMKDHQINDINDMSNASDVYCGQWKEQNVFEKAVKYCSDCREHLCADCCKKHRRFKLSKHHKLLDIQKSMQIDTKACNMCKKQSELKIMCEHCGLKFCYVCMQEQSPLKGTCTHEFQPEQENEIQEPTETCVGNLKTRNSMNIDVAFSDKDNTKSRKDIPGKPRALDDISEIVSLTWDPPLEFRDNDFYQVGFKELGNDRKWEIYDEKFRNATAKLDDLPSNKVLVFRVRVIDEKTEGPYSEVSNEIRTPLSAAFRIVQQSAILVRDNPSPSVYTLPMKEERHERVKINKFQFGSPEAVWNNTRNGKTILFIGETGSGKSTLIDFIVNYALGVNWNDPFRFKVTDESRKRNHSHATSLTDWITCYTINNQKGSRTNYQLNVIDTPGFGNTGGLERDQAIMNQMRDLLSDKEPYRLGLIDAICFVFKANENRLTPFQIYIFQTMLSLFGKDIEGHICSFITFADSMEPPVIDSLKEYKFPFGETFIFNNTCLFCKNDSVYNGINRMFWEMGVKSVRSFFTHIEQNEAKSLHMTKMVLRNQFNLRETTKDLQCQIEVLLINKNKLNDAKKTFDKDKLIDESSQAFDPGDDREELEQEVTANVSNIEESIKSMKACQDRLKEISLFCRRSSFTEYLDLLIQNEELEKSEGFLERRKLLKELHRTVTLEDRIPSDREGDA